MNGSALIILASINPNTDRRIFMGSGQTTKSNCFDLISKLMKAFDILNELQQPRMSTEEPLSDKDAERDRQCRLASEFELLTIANEISTALGYPFDHIIDSVRSQFTVKVDNA